MESAIAVRGAMAIPPPAFFVAFIRTVGGCVRLLSGRHGAVGREVQPAARRLPPPAVCVGAAWSANARRSVGSGDTFKRTNWMASCSAACLVRRGVAALP